jgi:hypothetical protein
MFVNAQNRLKSDLLRRLVVIAKVYLTACVLQ